MAKVRWFEKPRAPKEPEQQPVRHNVTDDEFQKLMLAIDEKYISITDIRKFCREANLPLKKFRSFLAICFYERNLGELVCGEIEFEGPGIALFGAPAPDSDGSRPVRFFDLKPEIRDQVLGDQWERMKAAIKPN